jgi:hypothetical protein
MLAASFWSLLAPAIALAEQQGGAVWLPAATGFLAARRLSAWPMSYSRCTYQGWRAGQLLPGS